MVLLRVEGGVEALRRCGFTEEKEMRGGALDSRYAEAKRGEGREWGGGACCRLEKERWGVRYDRRRGGRRRQEPRRDGGVGSMNWGPRGRCPACGHMGRLAWSAAMDLARRNNDIYDLFEIIQMSLI
jgi:hypothetical protein